MKRRTVLVTGANGFIGRNLVPILEARGYVVRRAVRAGAMLENDIEVGSIGPATDWESATAGVDAVIHLAARVHHPNEEHAAELYKSVNAEGTLQLAHTAARANVRRFVFLSSILVNGSCTDGKAPFTEKDQVSPRGVYGQSKAAAESGLQQLAAESQMSVCIVRPPLVYGRDAVGNFRQLVRAIRIGIPLPFGLVNNRRSFVSVQNLASFISVATELEFYTGCKTFLVADAEQVSLSNFIRRMGSAMDRSPILVPIPVGLLEFAANVIKPGLRDSLLGSMEIDTSAALSTGWRAPLSMDDGLKLAFNRSTSI
ncbi:NAD-dependent epimerase/dehydratase family protein [Bradyrhizobium diazoefficiens]|nr:NAD-dependent epimerase/dehydratase family protein [Bradyrhizobium diazoefficiens]MBR0779037.1 NAD-dependent epimerase/dehydratase family protein [Bradyrhizobium diazoefficiens]